MDSRWEPLPSDVADWMGMGTVSCRQRTPVTPIRPHRRRGLLARLAGLRFRLRH